MSYSHQSPGLPADWLNGWMAAIGATVLVPRLRLAWTDESVPVAVFETDDHVNLPQVLAEALPTEESLATSSIARNLPGTTSEFKRNVTVEAFSERARVERGAGSHEVAASASDLRADSDPANLDHGAFDPPAPRGETLWSRALTCTKAVGHPKDRAARVRDSLEGRGRRVQLNGLGFDARRLPVGLHASGPVGQVHADPIVELLCFAALALFPTRGDGKNVRQRGWHDRATKRGSFEWKAWRPALDRWAIDAFFDLSSAGDKTIIARYQVVPYTPAGSSDTTRAFFAERVP